MNSVIPARTKKAIDVTKNVMAREICEQEFRKIFFSNYNPLVCWWKQRWWFLHHSSRSQMLARLNNRPNLCYKLQNYFLKNIMIIKNIYTCTKRFIINKQWLICQKHWMLQKMTWENKPLQVCVAGCHLKDPRSIKTQNRVKESHESKSIPTRIRLSIAVIVVTFFGANLPFTSCLAAVSWGYRTESKRVVRFFLFL